MPTQPTIAMLAAAQDLPLITTIAAGFAGAWLLGMLAQMLKLSPIVGYLLAGVLIGPFTPGFVGDVNLAQQLAEVGVILLMFGVGLHFHFKDLMAVKWVAIPGAVVQSAAATLLGLVIFTAFGWTPTAGMTIGMAMAVASTVVLIRVLTDAGVLASPAGHTAVGWLIVEDLFTVVVLVMLPVLAGGVAAAGVAGAAGAAGVADGPGFWRALAESMGKLLILVGLVWVFGRRVVPWVLAKVARLRSREMFTLTVLVLSIAMATASYELFGVSMALGAFLAGMVVAQSPASHQAAADALPLRDAFAVLFFVATGMLFDPRFLLEQPLMVLAGLVIVMIGKPLAALLIVAILGRPLRTGLTVAIGLAQIGEFSFILSGVATKLGLMPEEGHNVLVATAMLSIACNPLLFRLVDPIESAIRRNPRLLRLLAGRAERRAQALNASTAAALSVSAPEGTPAAARAVVVGYGHVGRVADRLLRQMGLDTVIIDMNMDTVSRLTREGRAAIFGDAARGPVLEQAGVATAAYLIVTMPAGPGVAAAVAEARALNPEIHTIVRGHYLGERNELARAGADGAVFEEAEVAIALARAALTDLKADPGLIESHTRSLREEIESLPRPPAHTRERPVSASAPSPAEG